MKRFALAGNPNSGKTTLFNSLTGSTAHVGNWPGVTVEKKDGYYKKLEEKIAIIDLPGIYSLSPYTSEEVVSRNYILDEHPDLVINIVDVTNLERNLYLTTQLLEINVPMVVALNMVDVLNKKGDKIDAKELEDKLGVPVIEISALKESNLDELMKVAYEASKTPREGRTVIENKDILHLVGDICIAFKGKNVQDPLFHAIKLVENDELEAKNHEELLPMVTAFKETMDTKDDDIFEGDFEAMIADARYKYITNNFHYVIEYKDGNENDGEKKMSKSDKIDRVLTHRVFGLIIFATILFVVFHITFSENFLFLGGLFKNVTPSFAGTPWEGMIWSDSGINSLGVILFNSFDMTFGWIIDQVRGWMSGAPEWLSGFICDGALSGLFAILGFLPQIILLFLLFSIMEDSGYMARAAFILDKIFRKLGLSGRAFIPMIMGFGCSVPAMVNTRTLADDKERIATLRVIPFFSCGAKLPILVAIAGGISQAFGFGYVDLITYSMYLLGIITAIICVLLMRNTTQKGDNAPFIMELPEYRWPQFKSTMIHLWDKAKHFVKKAFTIILASTIVIWFLSNFGWNWHMVNEAEDSILASIGQLIQPLFTPLGFGNQLTSIGWVFAVAAITGLIAKENVIATFISLGAIAMAFINSGAIDSAIIEVMAADGEGIEASTAIIQATGVSWQGCISFIAFNMLTIPCFAACATAKAELPKGKFKWTLLFWVVASYVTCAILYSILNLFPSNIGGHAYKAGQLAWAIPVTVTVIVLAVLTPFAIKWWNKHQAKKKMKVGA